MFFLSIIVTGFIFYSSLQPADVSNFASKSLLVFLQDLLRLLHLDGLITNHVLRKLAHFTEFFVQGLFVVTFFLLNKRDKRFCVVNTLFIGLLTAVCDENIQLFVPGRAGMPQDVLLDFAGTVLGTFFGIIIFRIWKNKREI